MESNKQQKTVQQVVAENVLKTVQLLTGDLLQKILKLEPHERINDFFIMGAFSEFNDEINKLKTP